MQAWFNSDKMLHDFIFEVSLPSSQAWNLTVENKIISLIPKISRSYQEDLHEERPTESLLSDMQFLVDVSIFFPSNAK
jgi:hypothetical protein